MRSTVPFSIVLLYVVCEVDFVENLRSAVYKRHATVDSTVPYTVDLNATSRIDCGRECTSRSECRAFYHRMSAKTCKLVTNYNYIDFVLAGTEQYGFYVNSEFVSTSLPLLFCPSDNQILAHSYDGSTLTFRVVVATVSQPDAWEACTNAGERLMKIDTVEKQALVSHVLSTCPDFLGHDYWLDGYQDSAGGWRYADGSNISMNNTHLWARGNPDGSTDQCLRMDYSKLYRWNDRKCEHAIFSYICESL